jgi:hypothetical protein
MTMSVPVAIFVRVVTSRVAVAWSAWEGRFRVLVRGHLVRVRTVTTLCNHARAR